MEKVTQTQRKKGRKKKTIERCNCTEREGRERMFEQGMKGRWMDGRGSVKDKKGTRFPKGGGEEEGNRKNAFSGGEG